MADGGQSGQALVPVGGGTPRPVAVRLSVLGRGVWARLTAMSATRRAWLGASGLLVAALCAGLIWFAARPDWRVLFSGLDGKDIQQIAQELSAAGIPFEMTADGSSIEVDAAQLDRARMEVAAKGMPQSGRMGFELFDKPNWVGSEFDEKVNYQRALEGELEHTIGTIAVVRSARVHLVLPHEALFGDAPQAAKASVVLQLRKSLMPPEQTEAIRSLVAGAVENLTADDVTLVDADGRLNLSAPSQTAAAGDEERELEQKLVAMLEPTAGSGNVRATVNLAYDEGSEEKTDEVYDPTQSAPLNTHKTEQTSLGRSRSGGIPGTASNTPGAAAPGSAQAGAPAAAKSTTSATVPPLMQTASSQKEAALPVYPQNGVEGEGQKMTEETDTYAVTRHLLHSEEGPGRIRRLTAAVVVNDRMVTNGAGKEAHTEWKPRSGDEMRQLEQLARAAVGYDAARGDQVVIENVSFSSNVPERVPGGMERVVDEAQTVLATEPSLLRTVGIVGVAFFLTVVILKPMTRQMMSVLSQAPTSALSSGAAAGAGVTVNGPAPGAALGRAPMPSLASLVAAKRPTDTQEIYQHISEQIRREPAQSTRLLESWINAPAEEEE